MAAPKGNTYWKLAAWHRKPHYDTPEELEERITEYFNNEITRGKCKPTNAGLCYFLGFGHRQSMTDYMNKNQAFSDIIQKARKFIESCYESEIYNSNSTATFALSNMDREFWKHKTETDITSGGQKLGLDLTNLSDEDLAIIEGIITKSDKGREV
jgi:hypothetical protein